MGVMTQIDGCPDRETARPGMAFFAGTGPKGKTCGDCRFRGYYRSSGVGKSYRVRKCQMVKKMTGRHGQDVDAVNPSCKYFEESANAK